MDTGETNASFLGETDNRYTKSDAMPPYLTSTRFRFGIVVFIANILLYVHRVNLNMAVVCMLDATEVQLTEVRNESLLNPASDAMNQTMADNFSANDEVRNDTSEKDDSYMIAYEFKQNYSSTLGAVPHNKTENATLVDSHVRYEFRWSKAQTSLLLSASYYGAAVSEVMGGYCAHRFGGKHVISVCLTSSAILSLLSPVAASTSYAFIFAIRILLGFSGGLFTPAMYTLMMHWTIPKERASVLSFCLSGQPFGIVLAYITSGFLCALGWSTIFYVHGVITLGFMPLWMCEIRNTPGEHSNISLAEKEQLMTTNSTSEKKYVPPTPWKSILLSRPQWAVTLVHFVYCWSLFTVVINIPLFLKDVFSYIIAENGVFSSLPYVFSAVTWMFSGTLSSVIINKTPLTVQATRKTLTTISLVGSAVCLVVTGHVTHELRFVAVTLICVSCVFGGLSYGGYIPSYTEYAGIFSGTAFAITNSIADVAVILAATVAGLMTPNGIQAEWQRVFYLAAGLNFLGSLVYCMCGEATLQDWAKIEDKNSATAEIEIKNDQDNIETLNSALE